MAVTVETCFDNAMSKFLSEPGEGWVLVHGIVTGTGPLDGVQYGHAWLEKDISLGVVNGEDVSIPYVWDANTQKMYIKAIYYHVGKILYTRLYQFDDVRKLYVLSGNTGPWDDKIGRACDGALSFLTPQGGA